MNYIAITNIYLFLFLVYNTNMLNEINKRHKVLVNFLFISHKKSARFKITKVFII